MDTPGYAFASKALAKSVNGRRPTAVYICHVLDSGFLLCLF